MGPDHDSSTPSTAFLKGNERPPSRVLVGGLFAIGVALRLWQYLGCPSLWLDEAALARNIVGRSLRTLISSPLAFSQIAPPGFLLLEKLSVTVFGPSEYALRLVPLVAGLAAMPAYYEVAKRVLRGPAVLFALALFCLSPSLVRYSAEVKQYSLDVLMALTLVLLATTSRASADRGWKRLLWAGIIAPWLSQPAVFVLVGVIVAVCLAHRREEGHRASRYLWAFPLVWSINVGLVVSAALHNVTPETQAYLRRFWTAGFVPISQGAAGIAHWLMAAVLGLFGQDGMGYPAPIIFAVLFLLGVMVLFRLNSGHAALLLLPFCVALVAALARQYPFAGRTVLFLLPFAMLIATAGVGGLVDRLPSSWSGFRACLVAILATPPLYALAKHHPIFRVEDVGPVLRYIRANRMAGDPVYVYYGAGQAFEYYRRTGKGLGEPYMIGGCHREDPRAYLSELDQFRGQARVWLVFAHTLPWLHERATILGYLNTIGLLQDSTKEPPDRVGGSEVPRSYLYDLSDPTRLTKAHAGAVHLRFDSALVRRLGCEGPQDAVLRTADYLPRTR